MASHYILVMPHACSGSKSVSQAERGERERRERRERERGERGEREERERGERERRERGDRELLLGHSQ